MDGGDWPSHWPATSCAATAQDKTIINKVMLRFRPIAPKPASSGAGFSASQVENKNMSSSKRRIKRKYVRICKNNTTTKNKEVSSDLDKEREREDGDAFKKVVTLQLLPNSGYDMKESSERNGPWCNVADKDYGNLVDSHENDQNQQVAMDGNINGGQDKDHGGLVAVRQKKVVAVESWVTVECVTDVYTRMDGKNWLGCTDMGRVRNLEEDRCPGFITDGSHNVQWVNDAYKRMVMVTNENNNDDDDGVLPKIAVWLLVKDQKKVLPYLYCSAFSCWVRLQYTWLRKERCSEMVLPCDAWRMDSGGFAWRLDVESALSLGR